MTISLKASPPPQWKYFQAEPFVRSQREHTTVLFGGLTVKHERLVRAALQALGYRADILPTPTEEDFQTGKEFGNYGQCNPTYFTVGSLVNYLQERHSEGLSKQEVVEQFVYITPASPCGPCRLGMYQNEYRLATDNAGFGGFRVIPFEQRPKLGGDPTAGLDVNLDFSLALVFSILVGDILNQVAHRIRPYEVERGLTDRTLEKALAHMESVMGGLEFSAERSRAEGALEGTLSLVSTLVRWLRGAHFKSLIQGLEMAGHWFDSVEVNRTRPKPVVKITGEFWAQTTEGDGNFRMFEFLESEGAELLIEPVAGWLYHLIHSARQKTRHKDGLIDKPLSEITAGDRLRAGLRKRRNATVVEWVDNRFAGLYNQMRKALRNIPAPLIDQSKLEALAQDHYHGQLEGGEGHLEVAKNIYYHQNYLAHMVLSLKPFGCMPSTQSDAVQASAQGAYGNMIFLPIETSGEGRLNALSRVQMALGEAKQKAHREFKDALSECGLEEGQFETLASVRSEFKRGSCEIPAHPGVTGQAARLAYHLSERSAG